MDKKMQSELERFVKGYPFIKLDRACTINDGIASFSSNQQEELLNYFQKHNKEFSIVRFIPASGAASRMFKSLFTCLDSGESDQVVDSFFDNLELFPFYNELKNIIQASEQRQIKDMERSAVLSYLLEDKGLNFGFLPKGLIPFHADESGNVAKPISDHLEEACQISSSEKVFVHFTISPSHKKWFQDEVLKVLKCIEEKYQKNISVDYSFQEEVTNTVAVDLENKPFMLENGEVLRRPAGHGALLDNLGKLDSDVVYLKNIDNILGYSRQKDCVRYKQILLGKLLEVRNSIKELNGKLMENTSQDALNDLKNYLKLNFFIEEVQEMDREELLDFVNRPIRVCGMVKNQGEPGGGPFWIKGNLNPQIVEKAQVDMSSSEEKSKLEVSTHFNPVDLCCFMKDFKGNKFNLQDFVDEETGFISNKSIGGKEIKALELPGLWNGAMANWLTLFVEVPLDTFNPVKVITDLLKEAHQK